MEVLVLTSLGLGVALLGIVPSPPVWKAGSARSRGGASGHASSDVALVAYLLLLAGMAAKIGWAPVHNWLPDAHSEAPPPVSASCPPRSCLRCCSSPGGRSRRLRR